MTPRGNSFVITSSIHRQDSTGVIFQFVGQGERISTSEKPWPSIWYWKAFRIAFLVLRMLAGELTVHRSM